METSILSAGLLQAFALLAFPKTFRVHLAAVPDDPSVLAWFVWIRAAEKGFSATSRPNSFLTMMILFDCPKQHKAFSQIGR